MKNSAVTLALIALLTTLVGDVAALCRKIANDEMLEYSCEGGQPSDLTTVPETTEKLRITRMPLGRITADTFSRFGGNLWVLSCSHCEITDIDADAFRQLVNLQQLSLNNNYLTTVKASWLESLDYLTYLDLNYNNIRDIEDDVYRNLPSLVDFRISGNQLRCLNLNEMSHLKELKRIFLNENSDFACPHAVSKFLENQGVAFEPDPEWRRVASDTIEVPPSYTEEDHRILHSDKRPEHPDAPYIYPPTRDRMFHPDQHAEHRHRHRRPTTTVRPTTFKQQNEIPRVEPRFPLRTSPPDSFSRQVMMPYPLPTSEPLPVPPMEWRPSEDTSTYRYMETTNHGLSQTERVSMYPQHVPTYETTPYPKDSVLERLRASGSSIADDHETTMKSDRSSQAGNTLMPPLYVATSNDREGTPQGSNQVTHPSDFNTVGTADFWSTDHSNQHPYWTRYESSSPPTFSLPSLPPSTPDLYGTPYYARYDPRKMIVDESSNTNNVPIATDSSDQANQRETTTTTESNERQTFVRPFIPSSPELMYPPSSNSDEFYRAPYYESAPTLHPPLQDYREITTVNDDLMTTTDDPLPECPKSSADSSSIRSCIVAISVIITVFGHVIAEGF
ncbi:uncharacterized protein LOC126857132 [Cataglyphis hispanica]|uniref:uncharacterized protein LOC126857132 n=1 Tax=Cataglyphis hispanica TaxID=1086592 RepID=UPI00217F54C7|nr:uncharacterized protein LOC126857132 [Cataglyphis hispanica]